MTLKHKHQENRPVPEYTEPGIKPEPDNIIWHILFDLKEDYSAVRSLLKFTKTFDLSEEEMKPLSTVFIRDRPISLFAPPRHCET